MNVRKVLVGIAVAAVLAFVVWASLRSGHGTGPAVEVETVSTRTVIARVKATGEINPKTKVEIQSKVIGEIVALPVREGDAVKTGQIVVEIEKEQYLAARDQARAVLEQATVNLERARVERANAELGLRRARQLAAEGVLSQEALERAELAHDSAVITERAQQETIAQARSALQRALDDLARTTIRSPMDGHVTALFVEKGETAVMGTMNFAGSVLMTIGDLSELLAEVEVAESEVVRLAPGQEATVTVDALPDAPLSGKVVEIGSSGLKKGDVVKFRVKVALASPDPRVKPGMTAKVEIRTATATGVVAVPLQAVQTRWLDDKGAEVERKEGDTTQREVRAVYLFEGGKARRREVVTGIQDELWVEVKEGLAVGDAIITGPYKELRKLRDGAAVRRTPPATPKAGKP
ncbi:MAG TPA: efflux RND transporter periplasmic adaptor subunit [Thermoanaerobaculaceae bacterium]|nr:efflux RND transporter periplasmic adaptor subunit [Thermoanaerobaculaceae bacterium]HRS14802.1 efflux RND transporter periplasmic adaptor subunit [Thermoanaerobaculaceae bacterium]